MLLPRWCAIHTCILSHPAQPSLDIGTTAQNLQNLNLFDIKGLYNACKIGSTCFVACMKADILSACSQQYVSWQIQ
jgi:hypothetical protein